MLLPVLVGVSLTASFFVVGAVSYALWRYCFQPWKVLRRDILALDQKIEAYRSEFKNELGLRAAKNLSDEELHRMEAAQRRKVAWDRVVGQKNG